MCGVQRGDFVNRNPAPTLVVVAKSSDLFALPISGVLERRFDGSALSEVRDPPDIGGYPNGHYFWQRYRMARIPFSEAQDYARLEANGGGRRAPPLIPVAT
jgi:hypothetical protein